MILTTQNILLIGSILLFFSIIAGKAGFKLGIPSLLLFLGIGMLFGSDGLLKIQFNSPYIAQFIGVLALNIILFSGGMDTQFKEIRPVIAPGVVLATVGVVLTTLLTGSFIYIATHYLSQYTSFTWLESMLLAAIMSSTDSASVFSILRSQGLGLKENLRPTLELESGSNDPMAYMLTIILIQIITSGNAQVTDSLQLLMTQLAIGAMSGYLFGKITVLINNRINIDNPSFYSVMLLALVFFTFSFTDLIKGNGYLAVYISGLVVGNHKIAHKRTLATFFSSFTWLFQIVMFLSLGLLVNPKEMLPVILIGLLIAFFMIVIARPTSVFLSLLPFRKFSTRARLYISWVGLRGAVPIIFATYPWIAGIEHASLMFNIVFFITIVSLLLQGMTVGPMANWLKVSTEPEKGKDFDVSLPEEIKSALSEIEVNDTALSFGNRMMDLSLPDNTLVVMIKRKGNYFVPKGKTVLEKGDKLLVISDNAEELKETFKQFKISDYLIEEN